MLPLTILASVLLAATPAEVSYRLLNQEIADGPAKTEVVQHVLVKGPADEAELRAELEYRLEQTLARGDFAYNNPPTHVSIYIYADESQARKASGTRGQAPTGWAAAISRTRGSEAAVVQIDAEKVRALTSVAPPAAPAVPAPEAP